MSPCTSEMRAGNARVSVAVGCKLLDVGLHIRPTKTEYLAHMWLCQAHREVIAHGVWSIHCSLGELMGGPLCRSEFSHTAWFRNSKSYLAPRVFKWYANLTSR